MQLLHFYFGKGKGKTSSAAGACLRALGSGMRCAFVQFHKSGLSGETDGLRRLGVSVLACGETGFFRTMSDEEKLRLTETHNINLRRVLAERFDFIVLDELGDALMNSAVDEQLAQQVLSLSGCEIIVTGHKPVPVLMESADYITEFVCLSHPFQRGIAARKGVEY